MKSEKRNWRDLLDPWLEKVSDSWMRSQTPGFPVSNLMCRCDRMWHQKGMKWNKMRFINSQSYSWQSKGFVKRKMCVPRKGLTRVCVSGRPDRMNEWQWRKEPLDTDAPDLLFLRSLLTLKILARHQTVVVHVWTLLILPLINSSCLRVLVRVVRYALLSFPVEETSFPWTPETSNAIVSSSLLSRSLPDFFTLHLLLCNNRSPSLFWSNCPSSLSFESQGERSLFFMIKMRLQGERRPSMNSWQATHEQEPQNLNTHSQFIRLFWVADFVRKVWLSRLGGEEPLTEKSCPPRTPLPGSHFMLKVGHGSRLRCYQAFNAKPQIHATFFARLVNVLFSWLLTFVS